MRFSHRRDEKTDKLPEFVKGLAFLRKGVYNNIYTSQYRIRYCAFLTGYEPSGAGRRCFHVVFAHQLGGVNVASDLHCHTKISDGSMGIEELIAIAKRRGLSAISVTDHDTTAAATRAVIIGRRQEVRVIHGVEFSTIDKVRGNEAHLLCYLCDTPDRLEGLCRRTRGKPPSGGDGDGAQGDAVLPHHPRAHRQMLPPAAPTFTSSISCMP